MTLILVFCLVGFCYFSFWICICVLIEKTNMFMLNFKSGFIFHWIVFMLNEL